MSYASRSGHAVTDPESPEAFGVCDRSGLWYNFNELQWQFDWRGNTLQNLRILVRPESYDVPFEPNRPLIFPPDPEPVLNARTERFIDDEGKPSANDSGPVYRLVPL